MRDLNVRLLTILVVGGLVLGALVFGVHHFQVKRHAQFFLERAREAKQDEDVLERLETTERSYRQYLTLEPEDYEAKEEYGVFLADYATMGPQRARTALAVLEEVVRDAPGRSTARRKLVDLLMLLGEYPDARVHLEELRKENPDDGELLELLGKCELGQGEIVDAEATLRTTVEKAPHRLEAYVFLAGILDREPEKKPLAQAILDKMVEANPKDAKAYLFRGQHFLAMSKREEAQKDAAKALELAPDDIDVLLFASDCAKEQEQFDVARKHAERARQLAPTDTRAYLALCRTDLQSGEATKACEWLDKGIAASDPGDQGRVNLLWHKAAILLDRQKLAEAEDTIRKLRKERLAGRFTTMVDYLQARLDFARGNWRLAVEGFQRCLPIFRQRPEDVNLVRIALVQSGICYERLGQPEAQKKAIAEARQLGAAPVSSLDVTAKARRLLELGQIDEAIAEYRALLAGDNPPAHAWIELAQVLAVKVLRVEDKASRDWREVDEVLQKALAASPGDPRILALQANVLMNQDRRDEAEKNLRDAMAARMPAWKQWTDLIDRFGREADAKKAEAMLDQALTDWGKGDEDLAQAKEAIQTGDRKKAEQTLALGRGRKADCWSYVATLAQLVAATKDWDKLGALLDEAERNMGDGATLRLLRAKLLASRDGAKAAEAIQKLQEGIDAFPEAQRVALQQGLAEEAVRAGDYPQALALLEAVAKQQTNDLAAQQRSFEIAAVAGEEAAMKRAIDRVEAIEGRGPWWHYYEALRLAAVKNKEKDAKEKDLDKALDLLAQARILRPNWPQPLLLAGNIYLDMGNQEEAIKNYGEAVAQGARDAGALFRYEQLLRQQGQSAEADKIVAMLDQQRAPVLPASRFQKGVQELREQKTEEGIADIQRAIEDLRKTMDQSKDYREYLQLAQFVAILADQDRLRKREAEANAGYAEAEKALRRAAELAPGESAPWASLIRLMQALDRPQELQKVLDEAKEKIPAEEAPLVLGRCYELLERYPEAEQQYEAATKLPNKESGESALRRLAGFYARVGKPRTPLYKEYSEKAEQTLQRIIDNSKDVKPEDVSWARFSLAQLLLNRGGYANRTSALKLIDQNLASDPKSLIDRRLKARALLYLGSHGDRQEAGKILEELLALRNPSPDDRFTLAQLLVIDDNWTAATRQMQSLLSLSQVKPEWLQFYIQAQIRHDELGGAESNVRWLDRVDPGKLQNAILWAWLESKRGNHDRALAVLDAYVNDPKADPGRRAARLAEGVTALELVAKRLTGPSREEAAAKYLAQAETWLGQFVSLEPSQQMAMVGFLGRRGRREEALKLAESAWTQGRPRSVAETVVALLANGDPTPDQLDRVEKILTSAIEKEGQQTSLLLGLAELRTIQRRYEDAEKLYRQVLNKEPNSIFALNNLAVFLALRNTKLDEAIQLSNKAIEVAGPVATLCDTRATVHLARGEWQKALEDMNVALADEAFGMRLFHQAQALFQGNQKEAAAEAMKKADDVGLTADQLQPLERPAYRQLKKDLQ